MATFLELTDTPANYTDDGGKVLRVNAAEDAVEFTSVGTFNALLTFLLLSDTPANYTDDGYEILAVNGAEDAVVFSDIYARSSKLGVGTNNPGFNIHVQKTVSAEVAIESQVATGSSHFYLQRSLASLADITDGKKIGDIIAQGYKTDGYYNGARISFWVDGAPSSGVVPTEIRFETGNPLTAYLTLRNSGRLEVKGGVDSDCAGRDIILIGQDSYNDIWIETDDLGPGLIVSEDDSGQKGLFDAWWNSGNPLTFRLDPNDLATSVKLQSDAPLEIYAADNMTLNPTGYVVLSSIKTTTNDPTGVEGMFYFNTNDNLLRVYIDGSWRTLLDWNP